MFNKEGKLFGKISIIDIIVVLAIAVLAFGVYTRFFAPPSTRVADKKEQIEYTIEVKEVRMGTIKALQKMGEATDNATGQPAGKITDVKYTGTKRTQVLSDGTIKLLDVPNRYNATVKIVGKGKYHKNGSLFTTDDHQKFLGTVLYFQTKYVSTSGTILDIKKVTK